MCVNDKVCFHQFRGAKRPWIGGHVAIFTR